MRVHVISSSATGPTVAVQSYLAGSSPARLSSARRVGASGMVSTSIWKRSGTDAHARSSHRIPASSSNWSLCLAVAGGVVPKVSSLPG